MKRIWHHPEETDQGKHYWRSASELRDTPEFREWLEREFPQGSAEMASGDDAEVSRRNFMKLMGAGASLAGFGMAACRRPEAYLVPYSQSVEWIIPGKPLLYATAMPRLGGCSPLVVTTHEGRPTHVTGNRLHPGNGNGTDGFAQASVLDLYDPERSKSYLHKGVEVGKSKFDDAFAALKASHVANGGEGLALLVGESTSPTRARLLRDVSKKFPAARFYRYEAINLDQLRSANATAYGDGVVLVPRFDKAKRVLSLDCDFLGLDRVTTNAGAEFMAGRQVDGGKAEGMNRLYAVEANYTLTGGMADHRLRLDVGNVAAAAHVLARALGVEGVSGEAPIGELEQQWLQAAAEDLNAFRGEALVVAGSLQSKSVHLLVAAINEALGAVGKTVDVLQGDVEPFGTLAELVDAIGERRVTTLVITGDSDPIYDAPADLLWESAQKDVENVIHIGTRSATKTARAATWHVPGAHYLESWGDVRSADGTYSIVQPMIMPLYDGVSENEFILALLADPKEASPEEGSGGELSEPLTAYEAVRVTFAGMVSGDTEAAWNLTLRDGFLSDSAYPKAVASLRSGDLDPVESVASEGYQISFRPDSKVWDGRYINNAWQQEAPDPITKLTWDNAALVSLATAKALGVKRDGQVIKIQVGGATAYFPVIQAPGHADNTVTVALGYGQVDAGSVGGGVGFDAYPLRHSNSPYLATGASISLLAADETTDGKTIPAVHQLATTAEHQNMYGRALVREGTVGRLAENESFAKTEGMDSHIPENISFYKQTNDDGEVLERNAAGVLVNDTDHQWGMTIDLNQCIGCTACLLSCQSENNIPVVGKEQVLMHREMHWIRMDRYFATSDPKKDKKVQNTDGSEAWQDVENWNGKGENLVAREHFANPEMVFQPVACQQCELAPCETVCPVNATVHTEEGLNAMAYNRCIGTRYCANNCPYKARRFNFFDYNKRPLDELYKGPVSTPEKTGVRESLKLQKNPNVTVRMRGIMEKCTYCVQRIQDGKIAQSQIARDSSAKRVPTNAIKTACQESCPTEAIKFGNLLNPDDDVTKAKASPRNYDLLSYVGARPRTSYLARIKNPNKKIEELTHHAIGEISEHMH